jgi:hypothetical protein
MEISQEMAEQLELFRQIKNGIEIADTCYKNPDAINGILIGDNGLHLADIAQLRNDFENYLESTKKPYHAVVLDMISAMYAFLENHTTINNNAMTFAAFGCNAAVKIAVACQSWIRLFVEKGGTLNNKPKITYSPDLLYLFKDNVPLLEEFINKCRERSYNPPRVGRAYTELRKNVRQPSEGGGIIIKLWRELKNIGLISVTYNTFKAYLK